MSVPTATAAGVPTVTNGFNKVCSLFPDFRTCSSFNKIQEEFIESARSIMFGHHLVRDKYHWRITALELYLYLPGVWRDPSTHGVRFGSHEQLKSGTWYIHRDGKLPPKRLGIDITAGSLRSEIHAGLLIGAIDEKDGSATAVKTIVRGRADNGDWRYSAEIHGTSIHSDPPRLRLERLSEPLKGSLWIGPRKNLSASVPECFRTSLLRLATWQTGQTMKLL